MVSKAIDEGLVSRIQHYVANDINSKIPPSAPEDVEKVRPENVYVMRFNRILTSWEALATIHIHPDLFYEIIHDGNLNLTIANVYTKRRTQPAIL